MDFFTQLFGFKELTETDENYKITQATLATHPLLQPASLGLFSCQSLESLRRQGLQTYRSRSNHQQSTHPTDPTDPTNGDDNITLTHVPIQSALAEHAHNKGTFQVASQFNCLEMTSSSVTPEVGITGYASDATQGPACSIACAAATAYRNYLVPFPNLPNAPIGQTKDRQINNLDKVLEVLGDKEDGSSWFDLKNGILITDLKGIKELNVRLQDIITAEGSLNRVRDAVKVGVHKDAAVFYGGEDQHGCFSPLYGHLWPRKRKEGKENERKEKDEQQQHQPRVTQVFCSAVAILFGTTQEDCELFARVVLEASYEATLWAAIVNHQRKEKNKEAGRPRAHLTFVGGGVFGNRTEWIVDAINRAIRTVAAHGVEMDVVVQHYLKVEETVAAACCGFKSPIHMVVKADWICEGCTAKISDRHSECKWCKIKRTPASEKK